jgi:hypothetical protein
MKKFKIVLIALLITTIAFVSIVTYCYVKAQETEGLGYPWGMWVRAGKLTEEPALYREVPENVDKPTREALENPVEIGANITEGWVYSGGKCWAWMNQDLPVKYKGEYYVFSFLFRDGPAIYVDKPEQKVVTYSPIGFTALGALWAVLGVVWYRGRTENVARRRKES